MTGTKLVTVGCVGLIREIHANGPIKHPTPIKQNLVEKMVINGKRVFEHNPSNYSDKIELTLDNMSTVNFGKDKTEDKKNEETVAQPTPEVKAPETPNETSTTNPDVSQQPAHGSVDNADASQNETAAPVDETITEESAPVDQGPADNADSAQDEANAPVDETNAEESAQEASVEANNNATTTPEESNTQHQQNKSGNGSKKNKKK